ncbi:MAG TPA: hypothetical protein VMM56_13490 [Planctomycetaceae bacterium]|nr:hypothetical protein [Planctomycetaceae bacterium]
MESYWVEHLGDDLAQGDLLPNCLIPQFHPDFGSTSGQEERVQVAQADLIVVTQSCDLINNKPPFVALCPIDTLSSFEIANPRFLQKGAWEEVRKGRREGLHMLCAPSAPGDNRKALVVDFRQIISLPFNYLASHSQQLGVRYRLKSPFLEHYSQAFARFFMRVGLPSAIPPFK